MTIDKEFDIPAKEEILKKIAENEANLQFIRLKMAEWMD